jgi:hypothetical protein
VNPADDVLGDLAIVERLVKFDVGEIVGRDLLGAAGHEGAVPEQFLVTLGGVLRLEQREPVAEGQQRLAVGVADVVGGLDLLAESLHRAVGIVRHRYNNSNKLWRGKPLVTISPSASLGNRIRERVLSRSQPIAVNAA